MKPTKQDIARHLAARVTKPEDEIKYIRDLAAMTVEMANEPRMDEIKQRWKDVNSLRTPDRPPVWCNPVGCWPELLPENDLVCQDETLRALERFFRRIMVKCDIDDDSPVFDYYKTGMVFDVTPENTWGVDIVHESLDTAGSAWQYKAALETYEDFDRVQIPEYHYNQEKTESHYSEIAGILDGVMDVKIGSTCGNATICHAPAELRGLEQLMMDMALEPERVHQLMEISCKSVMNLLDEVERVGNITPNNDGAMFLSDPIGLGNEQDGYSLMDCLITGNSQEFDQVSPEMFEEFLLNYQKKIFERFGAVAYGCCENLTHKLDPVLDIPNLKIMVCSAWTDLEKLVDKVGQKHCIMWRHLASDVVCPDDTSELTKQINAKSEKLKGTFYQAILRELQTLMGHDDRLYEWVQITKEAVAQ